VAAMTKSLSLNLTWINVTVASEAFDDLKEMDTFTGIYGFIIIALFGFVFSMIRSISFFVIFLNASIKLHDKMFQAVVRSPLLFFDRNPIGIISYISIKLRILLVFIQQMMKRKLIFYSIITGRILNRFSKDIGCIIYFLLRCLASFQ
jgi:ABC-type multidrug transport system fused ATPase/permease subunit